MAFKLEPSCWIIILLIVTFLGMLFHMNFHIYIKSFLQNFLLFQQRINFSLKHIKIKQLLVLRIFMHQFTLQCKVPLPVKTFRLDVSALVRIHGRLSYVFSSPSLK
jgi:hypothetical protein